MRSLILVGMALLRSVPATPLASISYRTYAEMATYLLELNATFPDVVQVSIAQDTYGLPFPQALECTVNDETNATAPCKQFVVHVTNHSTLASDPERPEVFISGALHGNERLGPTAAIELIALFAHATSTTSVATTKRPTLDTQRWLSELVNTRNVIVTPMTNAYGYAHNQRTELTVDPNRDYNYMRAGPECMQTMTSRVVNEIWRHHVFQVAITFHGGTRAVAYEWGSPNHVVRGTTKHVVSTKSPDHRAQLQLSTTLAHFAGVFSDGHLYPTGTMTDVVYAVSGGMEDWGYAASWENQYYPDGARPFHPCNPTTFGGYPQHKTRYNNVTHRAVNLLVETANEKVPHAATLGTFNELYKANVDFFRTDPAQAEVVGHVPRNVRLALMMIEMAQPLIRWVDATVRSLESSQGVNGFPTASAYRRTRQQVHRLGCGALAWKRHEVATCSELHCRRPTAGYSKLQIAWEVLGALTVDRTYVQVAVTETFDDRAILMETTTQQGTTRRFFDLALNATEAMKESRGTSSLFVTCLDLGNVTFQKLYVRAVATVDQNWQQQGTGDNAPSPRVPPQSHVVNARTNPDWAFEWNGHRVKAALEWTSPVMRLEHAKPSKVNDRALNSSTAGETALSVASNASTERKERLPSDLQALNHDSDADRQDLSRDEEDERLDESDETAAQAAPVFSTTTSASKETTATSIVDDNGSEGSPRDESIDQSARNDATQGSEDKHATTGSPPVAHATQNANALAANDSQGAHQPASGLLQFGYLIMGSCAMIIVLTVAYLYRRVFRRPRQPYMNIEHVTRVSINSTDEDDCEELDDEKESNDTKKMELNGLNGRGLPQCQSTVRLHEMLRNGTLGELAEHALQSDQRYRRLKTCDDYLHALMNSYNDTASQDTTTPAINSTLTPYVEYLDCIGQALCEKPLSKWKACMASSMTGEQSSQDCAQAKRLLERCLRSQSEALLQVSQPEVFHPTTMP